MAAFHVIYGLRLEASKPLPGVPLEHDLERADVRIVLGDKRQFSTKLFTSSKNYYSSADGSPGCRPNLCVKLLPNGQHFGFFYSDGVRFAVDSRGSEVFADWPENYTVEDACTYLLGPVMGFVLRLRGTFCLHASAVAVDGRALALVGSPGAGKSTTAAAFACAGFPVLSDDVAALADGEEQFLVQPGYPRLNLWPDLAHRLFGSDILPPITPTWNKRYLPLDKNDHRFASSPLPLGAIYVLDRRDSALTAAVIEEVSGSEAFVLLTANTYVNYLLDQDMRRTEFDVLGRLVSEVPVRRVRAPEKPSAVFGLCEAIAEDARRMMAAAPANAASVLG